MACNREDEFPLTYGLMKDLYYTKMPPQKVRDSWYTISSIRSATVKEREENLLTAILEVNQPIWSLVEEVLLGNYSWKGYTDGKVDTYGLMVADQEFGVVKMYHMGVSTIITPNVTENDEEYFLLQSAFEQVLKYETEGKFREELMEYFEGEKKDG